MVGAVRRNAAERGLSRRRMRILSAYAFTNALARRWQGVRDGAARVREAGLDRRTRLLEGIDFEAGSGLEFGPLSRPLVRRPAARVYYVDHVDTAGLRAKYAADPKLTVADFVDVDVVWGEGPLRAALRDALPGPERWFKFAVASHVIEHVPDLVWWLAEVRSVMSSGGALRLVVPDRRFTMDIGRRETQVADAVAAYLAQARQPGLREILDFYIRFQRVDVPAAWLGREAVRTMFPLKQATRAIETAQAALRGSYQDVHCSVFTPRSFAQLMVDLSRLGMLWFSCGKIVPTAENELDFFVHMVAADDRDTVEESWRAALTAQEAAAGGAACLPQEEIARLREEVARQAARMEELEEMIRRGAGARRQVRGKTALF